MDEVKVKELQEKLLKTREENEKNRIPRIMEYFDSLKTFRDIEDIPDIPRLDTAELYEEIVVKNLIRCGAIPKDKLIVGKTYIGACRNASKAVWLGNEFEYQRTKFGYAYHEKINHFQDDDGYDLFVPLKES